MKRYGDNVSHEDIFDEPTGYEGGQDKVFFGGCGATFGSIPTHVNKPKTGNAFQNQWLGKLLSLLGIQREKQTGNN